MRKLIRKAARGFTLIELMIVVAIIGILAAIAIPNFIKFQARSKQSESKGNLKAIFTAERSFFQENDRNSGNFREIGYSPERGNRYMYALGTGTAQEQRTDADMADRTNTDVSRIGVDQFKYPVPDGFASVAVATVTFTSNGEGAPAGDPPSQDLSACPNAPCAWAAAAYGTVDTDSALDAWWISGTDGTSAGTCPTRSGSAGNIPAGVPFNDNNDVDC